MKEEAYIYTGFLTLKADSTSIDIRSLSKGKRSQENSSIKVKLPKTPRFCKERTINWLDILLTVHLSIIYFSLFPTWYTVFPSMYNICYPLSSTCFRPHRPIIRRSKLYMQPVVFSPSADVFVVRPLREGSPLSTAAPQRHLQRGRIPQAACTI